MESQPQNPEFRINPENFHQCIYLLITEILRMNKIKLGIECRILKYSA